MRWNRSRWVPRAWATAALMGSAWETATMVSPGWRATRRSRAEHDAGLHLGEGLTAREAEAAGVALHGVPLGLLAQVLQLGTGPVAEVALEQALVGDHLQAARLGDRRRRLPGALERRGVHRGHLLQGADAVGRLLGLRPARVGEVEALGPAGQGRTRGGRLAVPDEQDERRGWGLRTGSHGRRPRYRGRRSDAAVPGAVSLRFARARLPRNGPRRRRGRRAVAAPGWSRGVRRWP